MKPAPRAPGTTRKLFALSLSIALAMSGVGIIIPVVPSHIGRMGLASASTEQVALHVSLLAAGYAFMQLLRAPLWGRLSDSLGSSPLAASAKRNELRLQSTRARGRSRSSSLGGSAEEDSKSGSHSAPESEGGANPKPGAKP
jgi:MFS family permease